jgi:hypothetical protein
MAIEQEQPIETVLVRLMNDIGHIIGGALKEKAGEGYGFALLMFGLAGDEKGRMNYISSANREDMLAAMKEFIARAEGRYEGDSKQRVYGFTKKRPM